MVREDVKSRGAPGFVEEGGGQTAPGVHVPPPAGGRVSQVKRMAAVSEEQVGRRTGSGNGLLICPGVGRRGVRAAQRVSDLELGGVDVGRCPGHLRRGRIGKLVTAVGRGQPCPHLFDVVAPHPVGRSRYGRGRTGHGDRRSTRVAREGMAVFDGVVGDGHVADPCGQETRWIANRFDARGLARHQARDGFCTGSTSQSAYSAPMTDSHLPVNRWAGSIAPEP